MWNYRAGTATLILLPISVLLFIAASLFYFRGCYSDRSPIQAKVAVQAEGKTYLYSAYARAGSGETVPVGQMSLYKESSSFFIFPTDAPLLLDAMLGVVTLSEKKEPSFDGYFSGSDDGANRANVTVRATEVLGQQETISRLTSENRQGEKLEIAWTVSTSGAPQPLTGCELRAFWREYRVVPGETSYSKTDVLVVALSDLAAFTGASFDYDAELQVLTIRPGAEPRRSD
jgi:hypothetical protein